MLPAWAAAACFTIGFFTAIAMAILWTRPGWGDDHTTVPAWIYILASWGSYRPPSPFKRPPRPHDPTALERLFTPPRSNDDTQLLPVVPSEPDEWGDPDGAWVDELYEYTPRHAATDD